MARSKHKHHPHSRALALRPRTVIAKPIVIRTPAPVHHKQKEGRRHHGGGGVRGFLSPTRTGLALGALAVGLLEKQDFVKNLPALPVVGTMGTIAVAAYFLSDNGKNKIASDICNAAIVLAARDFGARGIVGQDVVTGVDGVDYVAGW